MNENSIQKCRICLKNSTKTYTLTKNVIGGKTKATYGQLLKEYAKLECPSDYERFMPQYLCILCCRELRNTCNFIRQAQHCNSKLINVISKKITSLQKKSGVFPQNNNKMEKSHNFKMEKDIDDYIATNNTTTTNEFRIVSTSVLLKSEVLEEPRENEGPIQYFVQDDEEIEVNVHDENELNLTENTEEPSDSKVDISCPICKKIIRKYDYLVTHIRIQHDIKAPRKLLNMQQPVQKQQKFVCKLCPCKYSKKYKYLDHLMDKHGIDERKDNQKPEDKIKCRLCDYTAKSYAALNFHHNSKHDDDKFRCKFCPFMSLKTMTLLAHVKSEHKEQLKILRAYAEKKRNESAQEVDDNLYENDDTSSDDDTPLTQKITKYQETSTLNTEMKVDNNDVNDSGIKKTQPNIFPSRSLPRRCNECGNIYRNYRALMTHQKTVHISEEKYCLCPYCGKKLKRKSNLKKHIKMVHDSKNSLADIRKTPVVPKEKRFMCTECSYICATITTLKVHMSRQHTGEKPYKCDICLKSFTVKFDLKIHRYLHTGERPYKCSYCSKGFRSSSQLIKHKRTHNNERPYKCKECDKSFTQSYNLTLHKRTHLKEKKLNCTVCEKLFENQALLNLHRINENHHD